MKSATSSAEEFLCAIEQQALLQKLLQQIAEAQARGKLGSVSIYFSCIFIFPKSFVVTILVKYLTFENYGSSAPGSLC